MNNPAFLLRFSGPIKDGVPFSETFPSPDEIEWVVAAKHKRSHDPEGTRLYEGVVKLKTRRRPSTMGSRFKHLVWSHAQGAREEFIREYTKLAEQPNIELCLAGTGPVEDVVPSLVPKEAVYDLSVDVPPRKRRRIRVEDKDVQVGMTVRPTAAEYYLFQLETAAAKAEVEATMDDVLEALKEYFLPEVKR